MVQVNVVLNVLLTLPFILSTTYTYRIEQQCEWDLYECDYPYSIEETLQFICRDDNDCPTRFMCCRHRCFAHKICLPYKNSQDVIPPSLEIIETSPGECDTTLTCDVPLPRAFTKSFECFDDNDCPNYHKCCFIECYNHKVCQKTLSEQTSLNTASSYETTSEEIRSESTTNIATEHVTETSTTLTPNTSLEESTTLTVPLEVLTEITVNINSPEATSEITTTVISSNLEESSTLTVPAETVQSSEKNTTAPKTNTGLEESTTLTVVAEIILETSMNSTEPTKIATLTEITSELAEHSTESTNFTVPTTQNTTSSKSVTEGTTESTNTETDDFETSGETEIIDDNEDEIDTSTTLKLPTDIITETSFNINSSEFTKDITTTRLAELTTLAMPEEIITETSTNTYQPQSTKIETVTDITSEGNSTSSNFTVPTTQNTTISKTVTETISTETDGLETSGDGEIFDDDEDNLATSRLTKNIKMSTPLGETTRSTSKGDVEITTSKATDDFESSGDFEIIGDDEDEIIVSTSTTDMATTRKLAEDSSADFEIIEDAEDDTTITNGLVNTTSKIDDLEGSGDFEIIDDSEDNATFYTAIDKTTNITSPSPTEANYTIIEITSKAPNNKNLSIESTTVQSETIKLETQKEEEKDNESERTNSITIHDKEDDTSPFTTISSESSSISISTARTNISAAGSVEANLEANELEASGDDEDIDETFSVMGSMKAFNEYNDDEDYIKNNNVPDDLPIEFIRHFVIVTTEEKNEKEVNMMTERRIENSDGMGGSRYIPDSNAIDSYAIKDDNVYNIYSYYDDFYDYNDVIEE